MTFTDELLALLRAPSTCYLATLMPDGAPQLTQTWVDTDGRYVLINTVATHQKVANVRRDPRVALTVSSPDRPSRYHEIRGCVVEIDTTNAVEHIEALAHRYTDGPYQWYGGRDQVRVVLKIEAERIRSMG